MSETDTLEHIRKINNIRPQMEEYSRQFIACFEEFINNMTMENVEQLCIMKQGAIAKSAYNTYRDIRLLHQITGIVAKEIAAGYEPIVRGVSSYKQAIDKYRYTVFMKRRHEFMMDEDDAARVDNALMYMLEYGISPIAIHDIIINDIFINDIGNEDSQMQIDYWSRVLSAAGRERDALLLKRM